jgi:hypothetical protein
LVKTLMSLPSVCFGHFNHGKLVPDSSQTS